MSRRTYWSVFHACRRPFSSCSCVVQFQIRHRPPLFQVLLHWLFLERFNCLAKHWWRERSPSWLFSPASCAASFSSSQQSYAFLCIPILNLPMFNLYPSLFNRLLVIWSEVKRSDGWRVRYFLPSLFFRPFFSSPKSCFTFCSPSLLITPHF